MDRPNLARRLAFSPFLVQLVVTRRCNLSCGYCNEFDEVSPPVALDVLKERIDRIWSLGTFTLELTGGEPMMHPEIAEVIRYAKSLGFFRIKMISNAYLFNEKKIRALNDAGLDELQISVDGVRTNDVTLKVLDVLKPKLAIVREHARFRVVLNGVLGAAPPEEALEVVRYARASGFIPRVLLIHDGSGQVTLSPEGHRVFEQILAEIGGNRASEAGNYRRRLLAHGEAAFKCRAGSRYLYVDEFGRANWCSQTRETFGVPITDYSYDELKRQFYTKKDCAPRCTLGCVRTQSKGDEWRAQPNRQRVRLPLVDA